METEETIKVRKDEAGVNETVVCGAVHTRERKKPQRSVWRQEIRYNYRCADIVTHQSRKRDTLNK